MSTNHNRIKVADLEKNEQNKILTTNSSGELEFSNLDEIKIDSYNGLDYTQEGKSLDARQGKVLKDLVDNKVDKVFGISQANKFLGTDENGNLKMFSLPNFQAPFLGEALPTFEPNSTGNLTITGAFFTPSMTVSIVGQTVNYITFVNDNLIKVNITTGSAEGNFAITLNNGLSATFQNALFIVLGTIYEPSLGDWENVSGTINLNEKGAAKIITMNSSGKARWNKVLDYTKNFSVRFNVKKSSLGYPYLNTKNGISLQKVSNGLEELWCNIQNYNSANITNYRGTSIDIENLNHIVMTNSSLWLNWWLNIAPTFVFEIRHRDGFIYLYHNSLLIRTFTKKFTENLKLVVDVQTFDIENIKYIELAS